jgi:hypothetical protein
VWIALLVCLVLPQSNRNWRAWLVLLPFAAVLALWGIVRQLFSLEASTSAVIFDHIVETIALSTAVLWLLSGPLSSLRGVARFFASLLILASLGLVATCAFCDMKFSDDWMSLFMMHIMWAAALVGGLTLSRLLCRRTVHGVKFSLWLLLWMVVVFDLVMLPAMLIMAVVAGQFEYLGQMLMVVPIQGTLVGVVMYLFAVPYLVLAFKDPFYRGRLYAVLSLPQPALVPEAVEPQTDTSVSSKDGHCANDGPENRNN